MAPPAGWRNPITIPPGQRQNGIDPNQLLPGRADLDRARLNIQKALLKARTPRHTPIQVTPDGVIYDGHHAVRAAVEQGVMVDIVVVNDRIPATAASILDLQVY